MRFFAFAGVAALALGVSACASSDKPAAPAAAPAAPANTQARGAIDVADQAVRRGNVVVIRNVALANGGFVVIHEMADGKPVAPGNIGYRAVKAGDNKNVVVRLTKRVAKGSQLMAMLHDDTGKKGAYEFGPGATNEDKPTIVNGAPVTKVFTIK